jgi:hypothetical protein
MCPFNRSSTDMAMAASLDVSGRAGLLRAPGGSFEGGDAPELAFARGGALGLGTAGVKAGSKRGEPDRELQGVESAEVTPGDACDGSGKRVALEEIPCALNLAWSSSACWRALANASSASPATSNDDYSGCTTLPVVAVAHEYALMLPKRGDSANNAARESRYCSQTKPILQPGQAVSRGE